MSDSAFQAQYRDETVAQFEQQKQLLRETVTTEIESKGGTAIFLVGGGNNDTAVTRGLNGKIPSGALSLTQNTVTLAEWHAPYSATGFNIFASQGNMKATMQRASLAKIHRKIDSDIITTLNTGTVNTGSAIAGTVQLILRAQTILGNNFAGDGVVSCVISPALHAYLKMTTQFASVDYINSKPFVNNQMMFMWGGINFIVHPNLPGAGTSAEKCFMYNKEAIGFAINAGDIQTAVGYNEEDHYSFCRTTVFIGSKVLQNSGIVVINHDGSGLAAA